MRFQSIVCRASIHRIISPKSVLLCQTRLLSAGSNLQAPKGFGNFQGEYLLKKNKSRFCKISIRKKISLLIFIGKKSKKSGRSRKTEETENEPEPEPEAPSKSSDKKTAEDKKKEFKFEFQIGGGKDPNKNPKKPKKGDDSGPLDDRGFFGDAASQVKF